MFQAQESFFLFLYPGWRLSGFGAKRVEASPEAYRPPFVSQIMRSTHSLWTDGQSQQHIFEQLTICERLHLQTGKRRVDIN
ncbi:hypothetical protein AWN76_007965 [Rhodothermaceae bacterium RA]|nr:hypothetical protein AWN76_007965 [Rhodothermaceae bacterium RA]